MVQQNVMIQMSVKKVVSLCEEMKQSVGSETVNLRTRLGVPEVRVGWLSMVEDYPARQRSVEKHEGV